jgi:hypothetical protein
MEDQAPVPQLKVEDAFAKFQAAFTVKEFAPPPHPIAIIIGVIGPLLTILALVVAFRSLQLNQQSVKISQRAYLSIRNGKVWMNRNQYRFSRPTAALIGYPMLEPEFEIVNSGNTPGRVTYITLMYLLKRGWADITYSDNDAPVFADLDDTPTFSTSPFKGEIGGNSSVTLRTQLVVDMDDKLWDEYKESPLIAGYLGYEDIFHDVHTIEWCWGGADESEVENAEESQKLGFAYPTECGPWSKP